MDRVTKETKRYRLSRRDVIESLPAQETGSRYYYDATLKGFALAVGAGGSRTFYVYRKVQGRPERFKLGRYPDLTPEQARRAAEDYIGRIARGNNPAEEKRSVRAEDSLGDLFERYIELHARPRKRTWETDTKVFKRYLRGWRDRRLSEITRPEVQRLHAKLAKEHGAYASNRLLALLRTMFNRAIDWGYSGVNPAARIRLFREESRDRFLQPEEMPRFFEALSGEPSTSRDFFALALLTGARYGNLASMQWADVSLDREEWRIPDTKNRSPLVVPLGPEAMQILLSRRLHSQSEFVFPGSGATGHIMELKGPWKRITERAGLTGLRIHDLRRSLGSWQARTGASLQIIGKTLGHKSLQATAIYSRLDVDPVRQAMQKATASMLNAAGIKPPAELVKLKR
ncbi:MAG: tyrosine-type recombinase/integrase [Pseudomonadota bacterium]|nr:tyrosine-type recombinase/integrase [Pseudomonadota bacterium]